MLKGVFSPVFGDRLIPDRPTPNPEQDQDEQRDTTDNAVNVFHHAPGYPPDTNGHRNDSPATHQRRASFSSMVTTQCSNGGDDHAGNPAENQYFTENVVPAGQRREY